MSLLQFPTFASPPTSWAQDSSIIAPSWENNGGGGAHAHILQNFVQRKSRRHYSIRADENLPYITQEDIEFDEFNRKKQLRSILAFLGASTVLMPLLTAAFLPFELLNPNLFLAKSLVLLTIPFGAASLGRSKRSLDEDDQNHQTPAHRWKKGLVIIHRPAAEDIPLDNNSSLSQLPNITANNTKKVVEPMPPSESGDQCLQRIACEGLVNSLPQIFIRSVWKQHEKNFKEITVTGRNEQSRSQTMIRFKNDKKRTSGSNKRKNLANYALGKIRPGNKIRNKVQENGTAPTNPPKDLSMGWFLPPPPQNTTERSKVNLNATSTTPPSAFAVKLQHQIHSIVQSRTTESPDRNETTATGGTMKTPSTTPLPNSCARYKCAFML